MTSQQVTQGIGTFGNYLGKGLLAGAVGTAAITISQLIEMRITGRQSSDAPAKAATKVLDIKAINVSHRPKFSQEVHWAYGTSWGVTRALLSLSGIKGWAATAMHFGAVMGTAMVMTPALKVAPPLKEWGVKGILTDMMHHAVYAIAAGLFFDAINDD
jgi:hypothetical protein